MLKRPSRKCFSARTIDLNEGCDIGPQAASAMILLDFDGEQVRILSLGAVGPSNVWRWFREPSKTKILRRNNIVKKVLCGVAVALLLITVASAQDFTRGGVQGIDLHDSVVLPPTLVFSNCGTHCTSYSPSGYYISGTGLSTGAGQTLAMGFSAGTTTTFTVAYTPNTVYTSNGGSSTGRMTAFLLNGSATTGPTTSLSPLRQLGTIPDYTTIATIKYKARRAVTFKAGTTYYLCETEPVATVQLLWMVSNSDLTSPFWFQDADTCTKTGTVWLNATGAANGAAFEIN